MRCIDDFLEQSCCGTRGTTSSAAVGERDLFAPSTSCTSPDSIATRRTGTAAPGRRRLRDHLGVDPSKKVRKVATFDERLAHYDYSSAASLDPGRPTSAHIRFARR